MKETLASSVSILTSPDIQLDSVTMLHFTCKFSKEMERDSLIVRIYMCGHYINSVTKLID